MTWIIASLLIIAQGFERSQPVAYNIWAIAPSYQLSATTLLSGIHYANPYGMSNLNETSSFCHYSESEYGVAIQWWYFGIPEYREDTLSLELQWRVAPWLKAGVEINDYIVSVNTEEIKVTRSFYDYGIYCIFPLTDYLQCFIMQNNIKSFSNNEYIYPESILAIRSKIYKEWSIEYEIRYNTEYWIQWIKGNGYITKYLSVHLGYSKDLHQSSAGVSFLWGNCLFIYSFVHHTFLGNTHQIRLVYSTQPFAYPTGETLPEKSVYKLDIQSCSLEELTALGEIPDLLCERIIKYRNMFGAISTKSLYQLGFTTQQVNAIKQYTCNYNDYDVNDDQESKTKRKHTYTSKISREGKNKQLKLLFQSMVASDIPAHIAIALAEEYQNSGATGVLRSPLYKSLTDYQRKVVKKACGIQ